MILNLEEQMAEKKEAERKKKNAEYMRKWRAEHPDKFKRIQEKSNLKYRMKNRKKIAKRQRNITIDIEKKYFKD